LAKVLGAIETWSNPKFTSQTIGNSLTVCASGKKEVPYRYINHFENICLPLLGHKTSVSVSVSVLRLPGMMIMMICMIYVKC
jgi:hypothetical protein